jgi:hypothetical protein
MWSCTKVELARRSVLVESVMLPKYVFSEEYTITENNVDLSGINNAYIIRFLVANDNAELKDLPLGHFKPFPSSSYPLYY